MPNSIKSFRQINENATNFQWRVSVESTKNVMYNGNKLMYTKIVRSECWLVDVKKVIFIDKIIDTDKDQFFKDFRGKG